MPKSVLSALGFLLAAFTAPAVSVTIFLVLRWILPEDSSMRHSGDQIPAIYAVATAMGVAPSLIFGGATLFAMKRWLRAWPPRLWMMAAGGAIAAGLYCAIGTLGAFAPWGRNPLADVSATSLMAVCILLSGAVAGLIQASFLRRG